MNIRKSLKVLMVIIKRRENLGKLDGDDLIILKMFCRG